ncbi:MAG: hypothetical protein WC087_03680 [Candidatus Paceibacterota bacterium]
MEKLREIEYTPDFKELVRDNPGKIKSFLKLEKEISEKIDNGTLEVDEVFQDGDVIVTPIYEYIEDKNYMSEISESKPIRMDSYLKVEIGEDNFFVKTIPGFFESVNGVEEFKSLVKLKDFLKKFENVEVLDFQLGYQGNGKTYFVSKWLDLPKLVDVLNEYDKDPGALSPEHRLKCEELIKTFNEMSDELEANGFIDFHEGNVFYDEKADKIYVYDVAHLDMVPESFKEAA